MTKIITVDDKITLVQLYGNEKIAHMTTIGHLCEDDLSRPSMYSMR